MQDDGRMEAWEGKGSCELCSPVPIPHVTQVPADPSDPSHPYSRRCSYRHATALPCDIVADSQAQAACPGTGPGLERRAPSSSSASATATASNNSLPSAGTDLHTLPPSMLYEPSCCAQLCSTKICTHAHAYEQAGGQANYWPDWMA